MLVYLNDGKTVKTGTRVNLYNGAGDLITKFENLISGDFFV
jgi:hypothetical protein